MNKKELIDAVAQKRGLTKKEAEILVDTVFDTIIDVPEIHGHNIELSKEICWGDYIILGGNFAMTSGTYKDTVLNIWGCDSIVTLNLYVRPRIEDVVKHARVINDFTENKIYTICNYK